ncbi:MAG: class I SAM-dependent methyltransferase [Planctomycetes bacterium]|nr:class I SAM-dependent methyltransferase [Planctomycetota bacterium]
MKHRFGPAPLAAAACLLCLAATVPAGSPAGTDHAKAERTAAAVIRASRTTLAPVYGPLAEQIVRDYKLAGRDGIGIDVGSGPGSLIIELCKRTRMHWINADINPYFFPYFFRQAAAAGLAGRISAILADATDLPFRSDYADVIVSRGSYQFWPDKKKGFAEIYRVLKPGGVAYVGRGLPRKMPLQAARRLRKAQKGGPKYDRRAEAASLRRIMTELGIRDFRIDLPNPPGGADVNYGIWVEFHKPAEKRRCPPGR